MGMRSLLLLSTAFASEVFWKCFSTELEVPTTTAFDSSCFFPVTPEKKDDCKHYLDYIRDGKALFENCLQKYIFALDPCDLHLKPEQQQLILQTFRALQQFIVICCKEYDEAFDECEVEICTKKGSLICDKEKNIFLPGPTLPYSCIIPSFCTNPVELMKCTPTIDIECFKFIVYQIKIAYKERIECNWDACAQLENLFNRCTFIQTQTAIIRIKVCIIALVTDFRTNSLDCSFTKYCAPLLCDNNNNFRCNVDPALMACFGFCPQ